MEVFFAVKITFDQVYGVNYMPQSLPLKKTSESKRKLYFNCIVLLHCMFLYVC